MRGLRSAAAVATAALGLAASAATAAPMLDQQNTAPFYFNHPFGTSAYAKQVAQTFTAGVDGSLVGLALQIGRAGYDPAAGALSVRIVNTMNGQASHGTGWFPTRIPGAPGEFWGSEHGELLASFTVNAADLPVIDVSHGHVASMTPMLPLPIPIEIDAGTQYAILLETIGTGTFAWHFQFNNPYSGGRAFYRIGAGYGWTSPTDDLAFQTFVAGPDPVPEPGTLTLLAGSLAVLGWATRRRVRG